MNTDPLTTSHWRPDARFWATHLLAPLGFVLMAAILLEHSGIDLWLADRWYQAEGDRWSLRDHWLTYDVIHHYGKQMLIAIGLMIVAVLALSAHIPRLHAWRRPLAYLLSCMALLPALIASLKHYSPVPCPWDLARYGGAVLYQHNFSYTFGLTATGHCFPAGHASGGFALLAAYFAAYQYTERRLVFLIPGLTVGTVFALGQQARGAHFLSHDLWSMSLCWFGALGLFLLLRPQRWPVPQRFAARAAIAQSE